MITVGGGEQRKRVRYVFRTSCLDQYDLGLKLNLFYFVWSLRLNFKQKRDKGDLNALQLTESHLHLFRKEPRSLVVSILLNSE